MPYTPTLFRGCDSDSVAFAGLCNGLHSGIGGYSRLGYGSLGVIQGAPNQENAKPGQKDRTDSREEHPLGPQSHTLLGVQIIFLALYMGGVFFLVLRGYKIADRGFDALDSGNKRKGVLLFWGGYFLAFGSALGLPFLGYWLTFESRFFGLL